MELFEAFNLIDLIKIHLVLDHTIPGFEQPFLAFKPINLLKNWVTLSISFDERLNLMGLVFLQNLLSSQDFLNLCIHFLFSIPIEDRVNCVVFIVNYQ